MGALTLVGRSHPNASPGWEVEQVGAWEGAHQGSRAEVTRGKAQRGEGEAARAPQGGGEEELTAWESCTHGKGGHVGDEVTCYSTSRTP